MTATEAPSPPPLLEATGLVKEFPIRSGFWQRATTTVSAVHDVDLRVDVGETLGLVGESGCGKSTTARLLLRLIEPTAGSVRFRGLELTELSPSELRSQRRSMQLVFQDPYASLNPRLTIGATIAEPLRIHGLTDGLDDKVAQLVRRVGLRPEYLDRYPHEFSGGQRQRIGIARALVLDPELLVLDEPVSALDVSIQAGVINLLEELQEDLGLGYVVISHDLSVVRHIADRVSIMYLGTIVEHGATEAVYAAPAHPYTAALLSAVPLPDPRVERRRTRIMLSGDVPSPIDPPSGCRFRTRCWKAEEICSAEVPVLRPTAADQLVACHFPEVPVAIEATAPSDPTAPAG